MQQLFYADMALSVLEDAHVEAREALEEFLDFRGDLCDAALLAALDVERHLRVVQAHAQQCPAIGEDEANALVRRLGRADAGLGGALFEDFEDVRAVAAEVVLAHDLHAVFAALDWFAELLDEVCEVTALCLCLGGGNQQLDGQVSAVIEVVVLGEGAVAARLDGQRRDGAFLVEANALVDDVLVAALEAQVAQAKLALQELGELVARDGVRDDRAARIVRREDGGHHGNQSIAADLLAVLEDGAHAVDIRVEDQAEVRMAVEHGLADGSHGLLVLRVRDVVREVTVRLEEDAARRVGTEAAEHLRRKEAARTVAGVDDDVHAAERRVAHVERCADLLAQMMAVAVDEVVLLDLREVALDLRAAGCCLEDSDDVLMLDAAVLREELEAVAVERQMAGRDHDRAVHLRLGEDDGHEHRRRGCEAAVDRHSAGIRQRFEHCFLEHRRREARVVADRNAQVLDLLARLLRKEVEETARDAVGRLGVERHRLVRHALDRDATHIAAIGEFEQILFRYRHMITPLQDSFLLFS